MCQKDLGEPAHDHQHGFVVHLLFAPQFTHLYLGASRSSSRVPPNGCACVLADDELRLYLMNIEYLCTGADPGFLERGFIHIKV